MFIPLLATLIMAGFVTTIGLVIEPAAKHYGVSISDVAGQFSFLTAGVFIGGVLAFFVFDYVAIKRVVLGGCLASIILVFWLNFSDSYLLLPILLALIGAFFAIVGCAGVTIITQQWSGPRRQTIMVAQDAMFNGGGIAFSAATTWFLVNSFGWTSVYIVVVVLLGIVVLLAAPSSFCPAVKLEKSEPDKGSIWNSGIILIGVSLLLFMVAKISILVWAPQFIQQTFMSGPEEAGQFMGNVFFAAFIGSLFGTWAASKVPVRYLLYGFVIVSLSAVFAMTVVESLSMVLIIGYFYGVSVSATYNSYVAFGLSFIDSPSHKHVVYLQLMSGLGSTMAPFVSSVIVEETGSTIMAVQFSFVILVVVALTLIISNFYYRRLKDL